MRYYYIDDLEMEHTRALCELLQNMHLQSTLQGVYWLPIPENLYTEEQISHKKACGPYIMALEIDESCCKLELLIRAQNQLHCSCVHYANPEVQHHMMHYVDSLLASLHIHI